MSGDTFRFMYVCASNGRHAYQCTTCERFFWFAPGRELDEHNQPRWKHCPACAGWRKDTLANLPGTPGTAAD